MLDRLLVRLPALASSIAGALLRLQPGSSLRRRLVNLQVERAFAAMARSDVEVVLLSYDPHAEVWMRSMSGVGISDCYRGFEGIRTLYADLDDAFDDWGWTVRGVVDGGDRVAVRGDFIGYGRSSGVKTAVNDGGTAVKLSARGAIVWQEWFVEQDGWNHALAAVGLSESAMSQENVEIVRAFRASADIEGPEGMLRFLDPQVEWRVRDDLPDAGRYLGHAGFLKLVARFDEAFEEQGYEALDYIEAGERVVVPMRWWGRGRASGVTVVERQETWVFTVRGHAITAVEEFATQEEALEAVGLSE